MYLIMTMTEMSTVYSSQSVNVPIQFKQNFKYAQNEISF
jgi:hypothetical protein